MMIKYIIKFLSNPLSFCKQHYINIKIICGAVLFSFVTFYLNMLHEFMCYPYIEAILVFSESFQFFNICAAEVSTYLCSFTKFLNSLSMLS